jgi:hypothetical protein
MKQVIKANDLVYVPSITPNLVKAHNFLGTLQLAIGDTIYPINEHGQHYDVENVAWNPQPFAFLATPEIQAKLEIVYGNLEDAPVDKELKKFEMMLEVLIEEVYDASRVVVIVKDGKVTYRSRNGKEYLIEDIELNNDFLALHKELSEWKDYFKNGVAFDGELYAMKDGNIMDRQTSNGIATKLIRSNFKWYCY